MMTLCKRLGADTLTGYLGYLLKSQAFQEKVIGSSITTFDHDSTMLGATVSIVGTPGIDGEVELTQCVPLITILDAITNVESMKPRTYYIPLALARGRSQHWVLLECQVQQDEGKKHIEKAILFNSVSDQGIFNNKTRHIVEALASHGYQGELQCHFLGSQSGVVRP